MVYDALQGGAAELSGEDDAEGPVEVEVGEMTDGGEDDFDDDGTNGMVNGSISVHCVISSLNRSFCLSPIQDGV